MIALIVTGRQECTVCGGRDGHHFPWCGHAGIDTEGGTS